MGRCFRIQATALVLFGIGTLTPCRVLAGGVLSNNAVVTVVATMEDGLRTSEPIGARAAPIQPRARVSKRISIVVSLHAGDGSPIPNVLFITTIRTGPDVGAPIACDPANCRSDAQGSVAILYRGVAEGKDNVVFGADINGNGVIDVSDPQTATDVVWFRQRLSYYPLGDSIASGHGLPDGGQDPDADPCQVSQGAYPAKVFKRLKLLPQYRMTDVRVPSLACQGASTKSNSRTPPLTDLPEQIQKLTAIINALPSDHLVLVSITVGADDFGFTGELQHGTNLCADANEFKSWVETTSLHTQLQLFRALGQLLNSRQNTYVVITDYFNPFNQHSVYFKLLDDLAFHANAVCPTYERLPAFLQDQGTLSGCQTLIEHGPYSRSCADYGDSGLYERTERALASMRTDMNFIGPRSLNEAILNAFRSESAAPTRVGGLGLAMVHDAFAGHESPMPPCGTALPDIPHTYVQYPETFAISFDEVRNNPEKFQHDIVRGNDCIHPGPLGAITYAGVPGVVEGVFDIATHLLP